ncbi:MAG: glucose-6-phosphate isomerase [Caulobacteraceae bacterium]
MDDRTGAWANFEAEAARARGRRIVGLFDAEPDRLKAMTLDAAGLHIDLSKQPWSQAGLDAALALARAAGVETARARLFAGEAVNVTEDRAALHMALRAGGGADFQAKGVPVSREVEAGRQAMAAFARKVSAEGQIRAIVHIGIGGSDLGPRLVWEALAPLEPKIDVRFVGNVDGHAIARALTGLDPASTLVIAVSKTFTTQETLTNAEAARAWLGAHAGANLVAVTAAPKASAAFGVAPARTFGFADWVGGRYSLWSAVGLACAVGLGWEAFEALLEGGAAMDAHFLTEPLERNAPVLLALAHVFNRNGLGRPARAVIPYAERLRLLPAFLQQLEMESNGKGVTESGEPVAHATSAVVFGEPGTSAQHAFFQQLHQGPEVVPVDFVAVARGGEGPAGSQAKLLANALAQAEALMVGRPGAADPHRRFSGDRPSAFILMDALTPRALGALIALYEHKVFVEGRLWGIDSFDQFGVELGKELAGAILPELTGGPAAAHDPSTEDLIRRVRTK